MAGLGLLGPLRLRIRGRAAFVRLLRRHAGEPADAQRTVARGGLVTPDPGDGIAIPGGRRVIGIVGQRRRIVEKVRSGHEKRLPVTAVEKSRIRS